MLINLGWIDISLGSQDDPGQVERVLGDFPIDPDLGDYTIPGVKRWAEGDLSVHFGIVRYPHEVFPHFGAVSERLVADGFSRFTTMISLATIIRPRCDVLYRRHRQGRGGGPTKIYATSPDSFLRLPNGRLCVPYICVEPKYRWFGADWLGYDYYDHSGFLVVLEKPKRADNEQTPAP